MDYFYFKQGVRHRWISPHIMLVMRITTFLLLIGCVHASANTYGQKVILSEQNVSLEQVISLLKKQTGYDFLYGADLHADTRKVTIEAKNQELLLVLNRLFGDESFTYAISDNTVVIKSKYNIDNQQRTVDGKVMDENRKPLQSASVRVEGGTTTTTDLNGDFSLKNVPVGANINITFVGYESQNFKESDIKNYIEIILRQTENTLEEANVINTGYYTLPKERATGSFDYVDNKLFNRNVGMDIITRLKGVTTSTIFGAVNRPPLYIAPSTNTVTGTRKITAINNNLQIRGISTLTMNSTYDAGTPSGQPLIILDNFPYNGDITNLNPNDVESVTVLKDAAASSIWGNRAANGVIVITTKKGKLDQPMRISLNSNVTVSERPNLYYTPQMSSSDFIDFERYNFEQGNFDWFIDDPSAWYMSITPIMDLLAKQRALPLSDVIGRGAIDAQINTYRGYDTRKDVSRYLYRKGILQQYSMNLQGGGRQFTYYFSAGYDHNRSNEVNTYNTRKNLQSRMRFSPIKKLELSVDIRYNNGLYHTPSSLFRTHKVEGRLPFLPYLRLADDQGNPFEIINPGGTFLASRHTYRHSAGNGRLLDWRYFPLLDIGTNYGESNTAEILTSFGASYQLLPALRASIDYQYRRSTEEIVQFLSRNSYYMRDQINSYALYDKDDPSGLVNYQLPIGDAIGEIHIPQQAHILRGQLNYSEVFKKKHEVDALFGAELSDAKIKGSPYVDQLLGYNSDPMFFRTVDYLSELDVLNGEGGTGQITGSNPYRLAPSYISRSTSTYLNGSYSYDRRYTLTVSGRIDGSNVFGVAASDRLKPSWSVGGAWNLHNEGFFRPELMELLKLRVTYGYMGNVNNSIAAYPTINYAGETNLTTKLNYATIGGGPNPQLSPERTGIVNLGVDFAFNGNWLSGSLEWYSKLSTGLIAPVPLDNSTGYQSMRMNSANLKTRGFDINLRSVNMRSAKFQWSSNLLLSHTQSVVTRYVLPNWPDDASFYVPTPGGGTLNSNLYTEGKSPFTLYTYKFAGLDPQNGDPMGYDSNGNISKDYSEILRQKYKNLEDHGSLIPLYYGALRNTCQYGPFSLSANILYKLRYKLSRGGYVGDTGLFGFMPSPLPEYDRRWQHPGDESNIDAIPSITLNSSDTNRGRFFAQSSARVFSADHIRLQDIRLDYTIPKQGQVLRSMNIYFLASNMGILWRANRVGIDPETLLSPPAPRAFTLGFNASF